MISKTLVIKASSQPLFIHNPRLISFSRYTLLSFNINLQTLSLLIKHHYFFHSQMALNTLKYFLFRSNDHVMKKVHLKMVTFLSTGIPKYKLLSFLHWLLFNGNSHGGLPMRIYKVNTSPLMFTRVCSLVTPCLSWFKIGFITWVAFKNSFPWNSSRAISYCSIPTCS